MLVTLNPGETVILIPAYTEEEYPNQRVPAKVFIGRSDRFNSSVEQIFDGPLYAAEIAAKIGCASAGHLALAIRMNAEGFAGNVEAAMEAAALSQINDGLAATAEEIQLCGKMINNRFRPGTAMHLALLCRDAGKIAMKRDAAMKRLQKNLALLATMA